MKIGVLTSSRADYGIYQPLLYKLKADSFFNLEIIAFGTHLSKNHGFTVDLIIKDNFKKIHKISSLISNDDENSIVASYGLTILKFADFWQSNFYDIVFCLGDRFEMSAAVQAGIPYNVKFAHIQGGETTLGAIDNIYRHQITLASKMHFTANEQFTERIKQICGFSNNIFTVGSLSLDGIESFKPIEKHIFFNRFNMSNEDFALITFHPETVNASSNKDFAICMRNLFVSLKSKLFLVVTMPNADTMGSIFRDEILNFKELHPDRITCIENFGKENYFSAMYYCRLLIGNTSSGILEAASFKKYVVNVGERQKGRLQSNNVIDCNFDEFAIINAVDKALKLNSEEICNVYQKTNSADLIIEKLKFFHESL